MVQSLAAPARAAASPATLEPDPLPGLLDALGGVADPRHARGLRHPLRSILALCILAFICGRQSLSGVNRFGRDHKRLLKKLGFPQPKAPSVPTLSRVLGMVEPANLQRALALWLTQLIATLPRQRPGEEALAVISVDGKTSRAAGVHVLNVFLHDLQLVLYQAPVSDKQNEISAFKEALAGLLATYPFLGLVVGDAIFAGEPLCQLLIENGRHYLFQVKADQPTLLEKLELLFAPQLHRPMAPEAVEGEKKAGLCLGPRALGSGLGSGAHALGAAGPGAGDLHTHLFRAAQRRTGAQGGRGSFLRHQRRAEGTGGRGVGADHSRALGD